ncbi:MAG TPA: hypothetical protein VH722_04930, partial [Alphaproteobacteria bacterium]|nr:hypothetical protein [Alphaproteobacteria bacterium]
MIDFRRRCPDLPTDNRKSQAPSGGDGLSAVIFSLVIPAKAGIQSRLHMNQRQGAKDRQGRQVNPILV